MAARVSDSGVTLDIRPGVRMLALFPYMNYKPWYALGEFVDNSIQSYLNNKAALRATAPDYKLTVKITLDPDDGGTLRVWDNAAGIAARDYHRAFVTAEPPPNTAGLSQFGIGMKSASCWFAKKWTVRTKALGETVARTVAFDVEQITREGIEHLTPRVVRARADDHFTEITLRDLHRPLVKRTIGKMKDHLTSMYRIFLRRGEIEIFFNGGDPLEFDEPEVLSAALANSPGARPREWRKELAIDLGGGKRVHGFAALRKEGSTSLAGFALFKNDRLIQGSDDEAFRPREIFGGANSYAYQRLFGELSLVNFQVSHTKDTFLWGDSEEPLLMALKTELNRQPLPLLFQAEHYRSRQVTRSAVQHIEQAALHTADAIASMGEHVEQLVGVPAADVMVQPKAPRVPTAAKREVTLEVDGEPWRITLDLSLDPAATDWLELFDTEAGPPGSRSAHGDERRLGIRLGMLNPFMAEFAGANGEHVEPLLRVAAGIALAETIARESGVRLAGVVRMRLNELLREELSRPVNGEPR